MREINAQYAIESLLDDMEMSVESLDDFTDESFKSALNKIDTKAKDAYYDYNDRQLKFLNKHFGLKKIHLHKNNPFYEYNKRQYELMAQRDKKRNDKAKLKKESFDDFDIDLEFWDYLN